MRKKGPLFKRGQIPFLPFSIATWHVSLPYLYYV